MVIAEPITTAELLQQHIPQLQGDIQAAKATNLARKEYFDGNGDYSDAFLELQTSPLLSTSFLRSRLLYLQEQGLEREKLRFKDQEFVESAETVEEYKLLQTELLQLQSSNQALESRLLQSLLGQLQQHSKMADDYFVNLIASWVQRREQLELSEGNETSIAQIIDQEQKLRLLQNALIIHFSVVNSRSLLQYSAKYLAQNDDDLSDIELEGSLQRREILIQFSDDPIQRTKYQALLNKHNERSVQHLIQELKDIEKNWSVQDWDREKLLATQNILQNANNGLNSEDEVDAIKQKIYAHKLMVINRAMQLENHQSQKQKEELHSDAEKKLLEAKREHSEALEIDKQIHVTTVSLREEETEIRKTEALRQLKAAKELSIVTSNFNTNSESCKTALTKPPMDPQRQKLIDASYLQWHTYILSLQEQIRQHQSNYQEVKEKKAERLKLLLPTKRELSLEQQENEIILNAIQDLEQAIDDQINDFYQEELSLINFLTDAKIQRKKLLGEISQETMDSVQKDFGTELQSEFEEVLLTFQYRWNEIKVSVLSITLHFETVSTFFKRLFLLIFIVFIWRTIRSEIFNLILFLQKKIRKKRFDIGTFGSFEVGDNLISSDPEIEKLYKKALSNIIDIVLFVSCLYLFEQTQLFLLLLIHIAMFIQAWRLCEPLIQIMVSEQKLGVPLLNGLQVLVVCVLGFNTVDFLIGEILLADRSSELLNWFQRMFLWILLLYQLGVWSHLIEQYVMKTIGSNKMKKWMLSWPDSVIGRRVRALIGLVILVYRCAYTLLIVFLENSEVFGSALARRTLKRTSSNLEQPNQQLLNEFSKTFRKEVFFEKEVEDLNSLFLLWKQEQKRGVAAIIGDHGAGKSSLLWKLKDQWSTEQSITTLSFSKRCTSVNEIQEMISDKFELKGKDSKSIISELCEIQPTVIFVDDIHRCMLRDVGGYDAIQELLSVMQGTSHKHFWVATFHLHAWIFLYSASTPVNLDVFRKIIHIKPLQVSQVKEWILERCSVVDISLDFSEITPIPNEESLHRAKLLFWRLLTDVSKGNPSVIEQFWINSLRQGEEKQFKVVLFSVPDETILENLPDTEAFILAYLLIHNELSLSSLQRSLNMRTAIVRQAVRNLQGLGLIVSQEEEYAVHDWWWPVIERFLVNKRMIYME
jgi:hypothetical protein